MISLVAAGLAGLFGVPDIQVLLPSRCGWSPSAALVTLIQRVVTVRREAAEADAAAARAGSEAARERAAGQADRRRCTALGWSAVRSCPSRSPRGLGRPIADLAWKRRGKGVLRLEAQPRARGARTPSPERLRELSRAGMRSYLRYWMEAFRLPAWSEERIARRRATSRTCTTCPTASPPAAASILALPHMGNWDLAGAWVTTELATPFTTVAERLKPESLYDRFVAYREGLGMEVLPLTGGDRASARWPGGCAPAAWSAWSPTATCPPPASRWSSSASRPGCPPGPALLALQTGALLLPVTLWYDDSPGHAGPGPSRRSRCPRQAPGPRRRPS